jgi:hypothetical protein
MAVGDTIGTIASVAAGSYYNIRPGSNYEWIVHNIYYGGAVALEKYDGTHSIEFDTSIGAGIHAYYAFHCTYSTYIRIKNNGTATIFVGYDGIQSKA